MVDAQQELPVLNQWLPPLDPDLNINVEDHYEQNDKSISSLHIHDYAEIGYCEDGTGIFVINNRIYQFHTGEVLFLPPSVPHFARSSPNSISHWAWIYVDFDKIIADQKILQRLYGNNIRYRCNSAPVAAAVSSLLELYQEPETPANQLRKKAKILELAAELSDLPGNTDTPAVANQDALQRIQKAINYMANHYGEKISLPKLARNCGLSMTHFRRLFIAATGFRPQQYLNHLRIGVAKSELGRSSRSILEISLDCGFPTISSFNRQFLKLTGVTPSRWISGEGVRQNNPE